MIKKITIFLIPVIMLIFLGFKPSDKPKNGTQPYQIAQYNPSQVLVVDSKFLEANQIRTWFRNNGSFNRNPSTGNAGFEWPINSNKYARYASGLWIGAVVDGDTLVAVAEYDYEYLPGYVDNSGNPVGKDDPNYRVYTIYSDTTRGDWNNWPVDQGAYVDSTGRPFLLGAQTQFYVYTDGYPEAHAVNNTAPLKVQVLQTNWAYAVNGPLSNMAFSEFRIVNRSDKVWNNCYLAMWTDDDVGSNADNDAVGSDTTLNLGYTYNFTSTDPSYGATPPAVGFDYFRGPIVPSAGDTVRYYNPPGSQNLVVKPGYRELGLTAFNMYTNGDPSVGDPSNYIETYYNLQGIRRNGTPWINPQNGDTTTFAFPGNPPTNAGWIETDPGDRRFLQCSGPITVNPGDTQIIIVGQVIARGANNLGAITALKQADGLAQRIFDNNFQVPDAAPCPNVTTYAPGNGKIYLSWGDNNERITIQNKLSGGTYRFQGYNIYQVRSGTNGATEEERNLVATYDVIDGVGDIQDSVFIEQYGTYVYYTVQPGSDNGISRYIVIDRDAFTNEFLINGTPYSFSVTAYYYDSLGGPFSAPKVNESPITNCLLTVTPQGLTLGTEVHYGVGDTVRTNQKDLAVMPIVFEPLQLKTATYTSVFGGTPSNKTWTIFRTMNGTTEQIATGTDFTGTQDTAKSFDGMLMIHQSITDSGIVKDPGDPAGLNKDLQTNTGAWTYDPPQNIWFRGPDTTALKTIPSGALFRGNQFQARSIGMSFPTTGVYRGLTTRIKANGSYLVPGTGANTLLTGGPLRKVQFVFGPSHTSMAYRYVAVAGNVLATDTNLLNTPYVDMVQVPFSVFSVDDLDSTDGAPRRLNIAFVDSDNNGQWDPDTTKMGKMQLTYVLASTYDETPNTQYTSRNIGFPSPILGFGAFDIMYAWVPRVRAAGGAPLSYSDGDRFTVWPYRPARPEFLPGFPVEYSWSINGSTTGNNGVAARNIDKVKVFPNPYYGGSRLETDPFNRFIYFSNLPARATIYIYTLDGVLVRKIERDNTDPNNSLEPWDLKNASDIPVASGMYIVYVDAKEIGTKVLKVAIFTPQERLDTF